MTQQGGAQQDSVESQPIVVGVDGSASSKRALRWAMQQTRLVSAPVEAVISFEDPVMYGMPYGWTGVGFETVDLAATAHKVLTDSVAEVTAEQDQAVQIRPRVVRGHPAEVLLDAAHTARLLVVGSRGHGTLAGMLLGSVSQHCVQHAPCPVLVVPAVADPPHAAASSIDT